MYDFPEDFLKYSAEIRYFIRNFMYETMTDFSIQQIFFAVRLVSARPVLTLHGPLALKNPRKGGTI